MRIYIYTNAFIHEHINTYVFIYEILTHRSLIAKSKILNMALSAQCEIISSHTRPVHCMSLEKQDNRFLLSGGLDGLVYIHVYKYNNETIFNVDYFQF
jgi:WD40 repeat protein